MASAASRLARRLPLCLCLSLCVLLASAVTGAKSAARDVRWPRTASAACCSAAASARKVPSRGPSPPDSTAKLSTNKPDQSAAELDPGAEGRSADNLVEPAAHFAEAMRPPSTTAFSLSVLGPQVHITVASAATRLARRLPLSLPTFLQDQLASAVTGAKSAASNVSQHL